MPARQIRPYGTWPSSLSAAQLAQGGRGITDLAVDGATLYWGETRPDDGGRVTILRRTAAGEVDEVLPAPWSARSRVHEYGGGALCVSDGTIYFVQLDDQRIYDHHPEGAPEPLTPPGLWRYADADVDRERDRLVCVREDHGGSGEPRNEIVAVDLERGDVTVLVTGAAFYACPRVSPDGRRLSWLQWDHPNMPWDGTALCVGQLGRGGTVRSTRTVAGGPSEAIAAALWAPSGALLFASDRSGWWNLYQVDDPERNRPPTALWPLEAEFAGPHWTFGVAPLGFTAGRDGRDDVVCVFGPPGARRLGRIEGATGERRTYDLPYTELGNLRVAGGTAFVLVGSPTTPTQLVAVDLATGEADVVRQPSPLTLDPDDVSTAEALSFPTADGATAHAFYYAPRSAVYAGPPDERPPVLVLSHGGPTGHTATTLNPAIQYWTTRGFGVLDVNYRGSTGFGRAYRTALDGLWGVADVDDCVTGARYVVERGDADPRRLLIRGGSAGGYTTLCALAFRDVFAAGASHYGVGDLEALARDTHKFESRYLDRLVGPYPAERDRYVERSPIHHVESLARPVIFFQGTEDKVVPPAQTTAMVEALKAKGIPVAYVPFEGEQHGFRRAENIARALEAELAFYGRVLGFAPADRIAPVEIANLR